MKKIFAISILISFLCILGVFMEDKNGNDYWFKYPYIFTTYSLGMFFLYETQKKIE
jgi:hypothetical protein